MNIIEKHLFYSTDFDKEEQDKEIWIDGKLVYTIHQGLENDDTNQVSPFEGESVLQTLYYTDKGTVQHNHADDSFYFTDKAGRMVAYVDGELQQDVDGHFDEFVEFAKYLMSK
ncbi:hypothetical protein RM151_11600 [Pantoea agglomerans]|uniref:hypothetical protein n=1 Tax=Enterobacter agglomerans TaxID=549 RepID=UPI0028A14E2E|nr:hypothetical protein [Pantoea agglomerans]WNK56742.1 hypothetical protein RM151_11600 [Pantoea agglomerans]